MAAYERKVASLVEPKLIARLDMMQPGDEIPIIGGMFADYERLAKEEPHIKFPTGQEYRADLQGRIMRAMAARKWFEFEAPRWAQPLPLSEDDCTACFNEPGERWGRWVNTAYIMPAGRGLASRECSAVRGLLRRSTAAPRVLWRPAMTLSIIRGCTVPAGRSLSNAVDCTGSNRIVRINVPGEWDNADLTFQLSPDGNVFRDLLEENNGD
jgi:hypothetical protein